MSKEIQKQQMSELNRRGFIRAAGGCSALSSTAIMSSLVNLKATNAAMAMQSGTLDDYKALVCVFLFGGNDSYNMLVPLDDDGYADYAAIRGNPADGGLALAKEDLLPISSNGRAFGIHPGMADLRDLYNDGACAFVANMGSLIQPTTLDDYQRGLYRPLGLFSHADLIRHWQTSMPQSRSQLTGWAGRMADLFTDSANDNENISMNISLSGVTTMQVGRDVIPYVVQPSGATELYGHGGGNAQDRIYTRMTDSMLGQTYSDLLEKTASRSRRTAIDAAVEYNAAVNSVNFQTEFPQSYLGSQMKMIAKTIGARKLLGQKRQIFFVTVGGWDHHDEVLDNQARMLPDVAQSIKAFYQATIELNVDRDVATFTASDFGRTLSSNGRGSDHAWGGNHFVVGTSVNGQNVHGDYPDSLAAGNSLDTGRGRLVPTTSVDEYAAELAMWFGMKNDSTLEDVLPNVRNFLAAGAKPPLDLFSERRSTPPGGYIPPPGGFPPPPPPPRRVRPPVFGGGGLG